MKQKENKTDIQRNMTQERITTRKRTMKTCNTFKQNEKKETKEEKGNMTKSKTKENNRKQLFSYFIEEKRKNMTMTHKKTQKDKRILEKRKKQREKKPGNIKCH